MSRIESPENLVRYQKSDDRAGGSLNKKDRVYGAGEKLRQTGGLVHLILDGGTREERRQNFLENASRVIFDSRERPESFPSRENIVNELIGLNGNNLLVALLGNKHPLTGEESSFDDAVVIRNELDVKVLSSTEAPQLLMIVPWTYVEKNLYRDADLVTSKKEDTRTSVY